MRETGRQNMDEADKLTIAYVTVFDSHSIDSAWSGTGYFIPKELERQGHRVHRIWAPIQKTTTRWRRWWRRLRSFPHGGMDYPVVEPGALRAVAKTAREALRSLDYDVVLGPGYFPLCHLDDTRPMVAWCDATFSILHGYHPTYRRLNRPSRRDWERAEKRVQERCALLVYASQWAANSAINDYETEPNKVVVIPFGANLQDAQPVTHEQETLRLRTNGGCRLLLVGRDWYWKGVDIACEAVAQLRQLGMEATLDVVGCGPPASSTVPSYIRYHGYQNKAECEDQIQLAQLYQRAHLLIHPSRAECFGIVMCEANAFALPVVANRTGGITEIVRDGENGLLVDDNRPEGYVVAIRSMMEDNERYQAYCARALNAYQTRLNWAESIKKLVQEIRRVTCRAP